MAEGNISGTNRNNSWYSIYCPDMLNTHQRVTKFVWILTIYELERVENKKKRRLFAMASFCHSTSSHCTSCVAFKKAVCKYFINKGVSFRFRFSLIGLPLLNVNVIDKIVVLKIFSHLIINGRPRIIALTWESIWPSPFLLN